MQSEKHSMVVECLLAFFEAFRIKADELTIEAAVEKLAQHEIAAVREGVKRLITSSTQIAYGQSPIGVLCEQVEEIARAYAQARREAEQAARLRISDPASERTLTITEYLANNPNSPVKWYLRPRKSAPAVNQPQQMHERPCSAIDGAEEAKA